MADYDGSEDLEQSGGGIDVPELALGISLIGLGAVLVFKALGGRGKGHPMLGSYLPISIKFGSRVGNLVTATVTLNQANPNAAVHLTVTYSPLGDVAAHDTTCTVDRGCLTGTFQFTLASNPPNPDLTVTVAPVNDPNPNDWCLAHYPIV